VAWFDTGTVEDAPEEREDDTGVLVLGIDPGFASLGYALVRVWRDGRKAVVKDIGVAKTKKAHKKLRVRASEDNVQRIRLLVRAIRDKFSREDVVMVACESMSWPRNAGAAAKVALAWGAIVTLAEMLDLPIVQASPQEIKHEMTGAKSATKDAVREAATEGTTGVDWSKFNKGDLEHMGDALGAALTCLDSEVARVALRLGG